MGTGTGLGDITYNDVLYELKDDVEARSSELSSLLINVTSGSETMSMMSGVCGADVMSIDSGPESEFKFTDLEKESVRPRD